MPDLYEILQTERLDSGAIYLYPYIGGARIAYDHSAIMLNRLLPNIPYLEKYVAEYGIKIYYMVIDRISLESLCESGVSVERTKDRITIKTR